MVRVSIKGVLATALGLGAALAHGGDRPGNGGLVTGAFTLPARPVWAGEVFDLAVTFTADFAAFRNLQGPLQWQAAPLVAEAWTPPALSTVRARQGGSRARIQFATRALALEPGTIRLAAARQPLIVETGLDRSGDVERAITQEIGAQADAVTLTVNPLPAAPAHFSGAIGHFELRSSVSPAPSVGQTMTWTLTLRGVGNWPYIRNLPPRSVGDDFTVIGTPQLEEPHGAALFERSLQETVALIPTRAGHFELPAVHMLVFDPDRGRYLNVDAAPLAFDVAPLTVTHAPNAVDVPADVPAGHARARAPVGRAAWYRAAALPPLLSSVLAGALLFMRRRAHDPRVRSVRAHRRGWRALRQLAAARDPGARRACMRRWQRESAIAWNIRHAAPVPGCFDSREWAGLWADAETFLYGRASVLPADWLERARRLMLTRRRALARDLTPAAAAALLLSLCLLSGAIAVRSAQTSEHTLEPLDWMDRARAATSLAARDRWQAAAAQAAIAWLQHPNSAATRRLWLQAAAQSGYAERAAGGVPVPLEARSRMAGVMSLYYWQMTTLVTEWLACACVVVLICGRVSRRSAHAAAAVLALAAVVGAAQCSSLALFANVADADTVLVWHAVPLRSLPVESPAGSASISAELPAGLLARADRGFLEWRHVQLPDGRAGWLRRRDIEWLWKRPATSG